MSLITSALVVAPTEAILSCCPIEVALAALNEQERHRLQTLRRSSDRADYLAAHLLARAMVARATVADPFSIMLAQRCPECGSDTHGVPRVIGHDRLAVSWSHTAGAAAAATGGQDVGVDAERVLDQHWTAVVGTTMTEAEREAIHLSPAPAVAFTRLWVRKEALVKAGRFRLNDLQSFSVLNDEPPFIPLSSTGIRLHTLWCMDSILESPGGGAVLVAGVSDQSFIEIPWPELASVLTPIRFRARH